MFVYRFVFPFLTYVTIFALVSSNIVISHVYTYLHLVNNIYIFLLNYLDPTPPQWKTTTKSCGDLRFLFLNALFIIYGGTLASSFVSGNLPDE